MVVEDIPAAEDFSTQTGGSRFLELAQAVQRIGRLQRHTINAQIDARQKGREVGFKRRDVGVCDANFMKELQSLIGNERLKEFDNLLKLAAQCQSIRDDLGPLEEERTMADLRLEGEIWKLQQEEDAVCAEFEKELESGQSHSPAPSTIFSVHYESPSESESQSLNDTSKDDQGVIPFQPAASLASSSSFARVLLDPESSLPFADSVPQDSLLLGLKENGSKPETVEIYNYGSDSGIGDIDSPPESWSTGNIIGPFNPLPSRGQASVEPYPHLITDFGSRRDRINKWLEHMMLASRLESTVLFGILQDQLNPNELFMPSNWSQLVIAYWELDDATTPNFRLSKVAEAPSQRSNTEPENRGHESLGLGENQTQVAKTPPTSFEDEHLADVESKQFLGSQSQTGQSNLNSSLVPLRAAPSLPRRRTETGSDSGDDSRKLHHP